MNVRSIVTVFSVGLLLAWLFNVIAQQRGWSQTRGRGQQIGFEQVQWVQERLKAEGFNPGPVDGKLGQQTWRAILEYLKAYEWRATPGFEESFQQLHQQINTDHQALKGMIDTLEKRFDGNFSRLDRHIEIVFSQNMNVSQTVFTVFFAIVWGTIANVQPGWRPFQFPLVFRLPQARHRVLLSILFFNVFPLVFFGWTLYVLSSSNAGTAAWTRWAVILLILQGVVPAFAMFGFYRMWLGIIDLKPHYFFARDQHELPPNYRQAGANREPEPTMEGLGLRGITGPANIAWGAIYLLVASISPHLWPCLLVICRFLSPSV